MFELRMFLVCGVAAIGCVKDGQNPAPTGVRSGVAGGDTKLERLDTSGRQPDVPVPVHVAAVTGETATRSDGEVFADAAVSTRGADDGDLRDIQAIREAEAGCARNDAKACRRWAGTLGQEWPPHIKRDRERALVISRKACDLGAFAACGELGNIYANGPIPAEDLDRRMKLAFELYERGCHGGHDLSCLALASCYDSDRLCAPRDRKKARHYRKLAAKLGFVGE